jgi:pectate lyase
MRLAKLLLVIAVLLPVWAWAALPANEQWRLALMNECQGYPCAALQAMSTSAWNLCTVTTTNESGAGSLRTCLASTSPRWIIFSVSGTIAVNTALLPASNTVIDGRTADVTITTGPLFDQLGGFEVADPVALLIGCYVFIACGPVSNVVVTHLKFENLYANQGVGVMEKAQTVWLNHLSFRNSLDELLFIGCGNNQSNPPPGCLYGTGTNQAPRNITLSWIWFRAKSGIPNSGFLYDCGPSPAWCSKGFLLGSYASNESVMTVTAHHNWYDNNDRHPAMNDAQLHAFNNFYDGTNSAGGSNTNICQNSDFRSENEIMLLGGFSNPVIDGSVTVCEPAIGPDTSIISCTGELFLGGATCGQRLAGSIFTPPYSYTLDTANTALRTAIETNAGWQSVTAPSGTVPVVLRLIR